MSDIFDEIREEAKTEKFVLIWKKYAVYIIGALVSFAIIMGIVLYVSYSRQKSREEDSAKYEIALKHIERGEKYEALAVLNDIIIHGSKGYAFLSSMLKSSIQLRDNDISAAQSTYDGMKYGKDFSNLFQCIIGFAALDNSEVDIFSKIYAISNDAEDACSPMATEILALMYIRMNDFEKAKECYERLFSSGNFLTAGVVDRAKLEYRMAGISVKI